MTYINPGIGKVVGFCLMCVSLIFTCQLLQSFAVTGFDKIVYTVFGASIQICQTLMFLYFWLQQKHFAAALFALLFCLSLVGSIGFFATNDATTLALSQNSDNRYKLLQSRSESIAKQLSSLDDQMSVFARKKWYQNGTIPTQKAMESLNREQAKIHEQMLNFQAEPPSQALYSFLAEFFVMPVDRIKLGLFTAYAIALDLCSVFLLAFSLAGGSGSRNPTRMAVPVRASTDEKPALAAVSTLSTVSPGTGTVQASTAESAEPAKSMMLDYVEQLYPVSPRKDNSLVGRRKIRDAIGISNKEADVIHNRLKSLGVVEVRGAATYPLMGKAEALQAIGGAA